MRSGPGEGAPTVVASIAPCTIVVSAATSAFGARTPASRASSRWRRVYEWNGELGKQAPVEQAQTMKRIVGFFAQHLAPHAKWEEAHLYVGRSPRRRRPEPVRRRCELRGSPSLGAGRRRIRAAHRPAPRPRDRALRGRGGGAAAGGDRTMRAEELERELGRREGRGVRRRARDAHEPRAQRAALRVRRTHAREGGDDDEPRGRERDRQDAALRIRHRAEHAAGPRQLRAERHGRERALAHVIVVQHVAAIRHDGERDRPREPATSASRARPRPSAGGAGRMGRPRR